MTQYFDEGESCYCPYCGGCGEDGCCSALACAQNNMVANGKGFYCQSNYKVIEFWYTLGKKLYDKYQDGEVFNSVWNEVYNKGVKE